VTTGRLLPYNSARYEAPSRATRAARLESAPIRV